MKEAKAICINCSSESHDLLFKNQDIIDRKNYSYFRCTTCYIIFIHPLPTNKRLHEIYSYKSKELESNANKLLFLFLKLPPAQFLLRLFGDRVNKERAEFVEAHVRKKNKILDVGCGTGAFLVEMKKMGWKVAGQEVSKPSYDISRKALGKDVLLINESLEEAKLPKDINVITMWHVFEHIVNFKEILGHIQKSLNKGDVLIMETPNERGFSMKLFGKYSPMLITPEHLTFWSNDGFTHVLRENGFTVKSVTYPKTFLFTTASSAFNFAQDRFHNVFISAIFAVPFLPLSIFIYFLFPKYNESIRVVAVHK